MPEQVAIEAVPFQQRIRLPSADWGRADTDVRPPFLLDAAGVDGRFKGAARSHPGFRAVGLVECNDWNGPLLVGPGIDHTTDGNIATWCYWPLKLHRNDGFSATAQVYFFKALSFKKSQATADLVSGFVMFLPYEGPTPGVNYWNSGLPRLGSVHGNVVAFVYWDDEEYLHPILSGVTHAAGWRVRILGKTTVKQGALYVDVPTWGPGNMDVSAWGSYGYIVNPDIAGEGQALWGPPETLSPSIVPDGGVGPQVLYYGEDEHYVKMRPMGSHIDGLAVPTIWIGDSEEPQGCIGSAVGEYVAVGVTLKNVATGAMSNMVQTTIFIPAGGLFRWGYVTVNVPFAAWDRSQTTVQVWRSPVGTTGALFLEHEFTLPDNPPAFNVTYDGATDTGYRTYLFTFACNWSEGAWYLLTQGAIPEQWRLAGRGHGRIGVPDEQLVMLSSYAGYYQYDEPPPADATRIVARDAMTYMVSGKAKLDEPASGAMPPRLRWSSPYLPRPEDYSDLAMKWAPDEHIGLVYGGAKVGGFVFWVGTSGVIASRRVGDRVVVSQAGDDLAPVSSTAWCVGGDRLFVLTTKGLMAVSSVDGSVAPVEEVGWIVTALDAWGPELTLDGTGYRTTIRLAYDGAADCLYVINVNRMEALCVWVSTGAVTRLYDFTWQMATQGAIRGVGDSDVGKPTRERAFFCFELGCNTPLPGADWDAFPHLLDVFYADVCPSPPASSNDYALGCTATMHGLAVGMSESGSSITRLETELLQGTIPAAAFTAPDTYGLSLLAFTPAGGNPGGSTTIMLVKRRFNGALVHLVSADGLTHVRRMLSSCDIVGGKVRLYLYPTLSTDEKAALVGGTWALAPIVFCLKTAPLYVQPDIFLGSVASITGMSIVGDFIFARQYFSHDHSEFRQVVLVRDVARTVLWAFAESVREDALAVEDACRVPYLRNEACDAASLEAIVGQAWKLPIGRFREVVRQRLTVSRQERSSTARLQVKGQSVCLGVEALLCGVVYELRGLRALGSVVPRP